MHLLEATLRHGLEPGTNLPVAGADDCWVVLLPPIDGHNVLALGDLPNRLLPTLSRGSTAVLHLKLAQPLDGLRRRPPADLLVVAARTLPRLARDARAAALLREALTADATVIVTGTGLSSGRRLQHHLQRVLLVEGVITTLQPVASSRGAGQPGGRFLGVPPLVLGRSKSRVRRRLSRAIHLLEAQARKAVTRGRAFPPAEHASDLRPLRP